MVHSAGAAGTAHAHPGKEEKDGRAFRERAPRKNVGLTGFAVVGDGTSFSFSVLDLSYDGCKIEPEIALFPGVQLKVSVLGFRGQIDAQVRWHKDGRSGLKFANEELPKAEQTPRQWERRAVSGSLGLRRVGRKQYVAQVFDIAPGGCKVEFVERARPGELVWVKFDGLESMEAIVRWTDGYYGGLQFVQPVHAAIFDSLMAKLDA